LPNTAQNVFASSHESKNGRILRNLIVNCTSFARSDAPKVTLWSHLNDVFPAPGATKNFIHHGNVGFGFMAQRGA
jgi:hypothetical protein